VNTGKRKVGRRFVKEIFLHAERKTQGGGKKSTCFPAGKGRRDSSVWESSSTTKRGRRRGIVPLLGGANPRGSKLPSRNPVFEKKKERRPPRFTKRRKGKKTMGKLLLQKNAYIFLSLAKKSCRSKKKKERRSFSRRGPYLSCIEDAAFKALRKGGRRKKKKTAILACGDDTLLPKNPAGLIL